MSFTDYYGIISCIKLILFIQYKYVVKIKQRYRTALDYFKSCLSIGIGIRLFVEYVQLRKYP